MSPFQLLQLELKKFVPSGTFRLLSLLYLGFFVMMVYLAYGFGHHFTFSANGNTINPAQDLFCFPRLWEMVAYIGRWLNALLLGLMGVLLITLELGNRTLRQNVITGLNRNEVVIAKITTAGAIAVVVTVAYLLIGAVAGELGSPATPLDQTLPPILLVLRFLLNAFGYLLWGMVFGFILRQTALAIILYFPYVLFVEWAFHGIVHLIAGDSLLDYLPDQVMRGLITFPTPAMAEQLINSQHLHSGPSPLAIAVAAVVYIGLFIYVLWNRVCHSDL